MTACDCHIDPWLGLDCLLESLRSHIMVAASVCCTRKFMLLGASLKSAVADCQTFYTWPPMGQGPLLRMSSPPFPAGYVKLAYTLALRYFLDSFKGFSTLWIAMDGHYTSDCCLM